MFSPELGGCVKLWVTISTISYSIFHPKVFAAAKLKQLELIGASGTKLGSGPR